jgi:polycomb group RING finger protein 3
MDVDEDPVPPPVPDTEGEAHMGPEVTEMDVDVNTDTKSSSEPQEKEKEGDREEAEEKVTPAQEPTPKPQAEAETVAKKAEAHPAEKEKPVMPPPVQHSPAKSAESDSGDGSSSGSSSDSDSDSDSSEDDSSEDDVPPLPEEVHVTFSEINKHLSCVICFGYLRKARMVQDCGHVFCEPCLDDALRRSWIKNKSYRCPNLNCSVSMTSANPLATCTREDRVLQNLVDIICPEFAARDARERAEARKAVSPSPSPAPSSSSSAASRVKLPVMFVELAPHKQGVGRLKEPILQVPTTFTTGQIKKYLVKKMPKAVRTSQVHLFIKTKEVLGDDHGLQFMRQLHGVSRTHLVVQYTI